MGVEWERERGGGRVVQAGISGRGWEESEGVRRMERRAGEGVKVEQVGADSLKNDLEVTLTLKICLRVGWRVG